MVVAQLLQHGNLNNDGPEPTLRPLNQPEGQSVGRLLYRFSIRFFPPPKADARIVVAAIVVTITPHPHPHPAQAQAQTSTGHQTTDGRACEQRMQPAPAASKAAVHFVRLPVGQLAAESRGGSVRLRRASPWRARSPARPPTRTRLFAAAAAEWGFFLSCGASFSRAAANQPLNEIDGSDTHLQSWPKSRPSSSSSNELCFLLSEQGARALGRALASCSSASLLLLPALLLLASACQRQR